jgi:hypothetical protein
MIDGLLNAPTLGAPELMAVVSHERLPTINQKRN